MSLAEVLPNVLTLSRADKLRLIQYLAQDLVQGEERGQIDSGQSYTVWSPHEAFDAAAVMMQFLRADDPHFSG